MASDWDALLVDDAWDDRPYDPDDRAAFDDEPLDSLVMEARDRLNCIGLFAAAAVVFALALLVVQTRDPILDPTAGYIGALLLGASAGLMATMLFWLVVFARHRRIAYRGDWARAIRRGGWVVPRDRPVRRPPPQQGLLAGDRPVHPRARRGRGGDALGRALRSRTNLGGALCPAAPCRASNPPRPTPR